MTHNVFRVRCPPFRRCHRRSRERSEVTNDRFWTAALVDECYRANRIEVAERDGAVIGVAMAGPPESPEPGWSLHLYVLYVLAAHHGSGARAALLDAVVGPQESFAARIG